MSLKRRFRPLPISQIRLTDSFWSRWQTVLREKTLLAVYEKLVETERIAHFRRAAGLEPGSFSGYYFNDSDVYKWLEACAYALALGPLPKIEALCDETIAVIAKAQQPDGYLNTYFQLDHPNLKFRNLCALHELYCLGHLYEAAVEYAQATGKTALLDVATKSADMVASIFGPGKRRGYCGHEEIELGLLKLADHTRRPEYADLARWMVEERGRKPSAFLPEFDDAQAMSLSEWVIKELYPNREYKGDYCQDHAPIREHTEVVGHAVRAMYLYIAAAELANGKNDVALEDAVLRCWDNLTRKRMYVTAGVGPAAQNEGFTTDYDLPNHSAYAETCATIGLVLWGQRLLELTGNSDYADVVERALYNGTISGISLDGDKFFYTNPLESRGQHERVPWFHCACCPPNIARLLGQVSRFSVGCGDDSLWIHIPTGFEATAQIAGVAVKATCVSNYPWSGDFSLTIEPERPAVFDVRLRIPGWATNATFEIEGDKKPAEFEDGYAVFRRTWQAGDTIHGDIEMPARWVQANPQVSDDLGRVCLSRGPLVYCLEQHDLGERPQLFTAHTDSELAVEAQPGLLEGVYTVSVEGSVDDVTVEELYADLGSFGGTVRTAKFIPYYAWCNRGPNAMQVWVRSI